MVGLSPLPYVGSISDPCFFLFAFTSEYMISTVESVTTLGNKKVVGQVCAFDEGRRGAGVLTQSAGSRCKISTGKEMG